MNTVTIGWGFAALLAALTLLAAGVTRWSGTGAGRAPVIAAKPFKLNPDFIQLRLVGDIDWSDVGATCWVTDGEPFEGQPLEGFADGAEADAQPFAEGLIDQ